MSPVAVTDDYIVPSLPPDLLRARQQQARTASSGRVLRSSVAALSTSQLSNNTDASVLCAHAQQTRASSWQPVDTTLPSLGTGAAFADPFSAVDNNPFPLPQEHSAPLSMEDYGTHPSVGAVQHLVPSLSQGLVPAQVATSGAPGSSAAAAAAAALTTAQRQELAIARRRADKAAASKRTRGYNGILEAFSEGGSAVGELSTGTGGYGEDELDFTRTNEEIEARLATVGDEKESKRLKRLLRNRISAQQARERKKSYVSSLEERVKELEDRCATLEQRTNTLERENQMLRRVIMNMKTSNAGTINNSQRAPADSVDEDEDMEDGSEEEEDEGLESDT